MTTTTNGGAVLEHAIGPRGELSLRTHSGSVMVEATEGETVRIVDLDGRALDDRFTIEGGEGRLSIAPRDRIGIDLGFGLGRRGSARLAVLVPPSAAVSIDTASADIHATGLSGEQRFRTASGTLEIDRAQGPLGIDTVSGDVTIQAIGEMDLSGRLVSGDLAVAGGRLRSAALATTSGDMRLAAPLDGPGPYSLQTVSGDAFVMSPPAGLRVDANTLTGEIRTADGRRGASRRGSSAVVVGAGGGPTLTFKSISGDLRIASAEPVSGVSVSPAMPEPPAPPAPPAPPTSAVEAESGPAEAVADQDAAHDPRLEILRELETGTIDVATATERLAELERETDA